MNQLQEEDETYKKPTYCRADKLPRNVIIISNYLS